LKYNAQDILQIQIRRENTETPLTVYDGDLVILDTTFKTYHMDYQTNDDVPTLSPDSKYYYSIFYKSGVSTNASIRIKDFDIQTLSYKSGMMQIIQEFITYSKTKNASLNYMLSSELTDLIFESDKTFSNTTLMLDIAGFIVPSLLYSPTDTEQDVTKRNQNYIFIEELIKTKPVFAIDYLSNTNTSGLNTSRANFSNRSLIGFNRPGATTNFFENLPTVIDENANTTISSLTDTNLKNFIFLDAPVTNLVASLNVTNYDLIVMTPFKSQAWDSLSNMYTSTEVNSLKTKANNTNQRLVFAYIDLSRVWKDSFYWQTAWLDKRPNWIDPNVTTNSLDYYVKYWRNDWKTIIKQILDKVTVSGYDGIVFGGTDVYSKHPRTN
tara:strand:- start:6372 stop:7514 length:1143 start_codon:yes stop_codon:yes gene_type:complete